MDHLFPSVEPPVVASHCSATIFASISPEGLMLDIFTFTRLLPGKAINPWTPSGRATRTDVPLNIQTQVSHQACNSHSATFFRWLGFCCGDRSDPSHQLWSCHCEISLVEVALRHQVCRHQMRTLIIVQVTRSPLWTRLPPVVIPVFCPVDSPNCITRQVLTRHLQKLTNRLLAPQRERIVTHRTQGH